MQSTEKIRALNDAFRKTLKGGKVMMTGNIDGRADRYEIVKAVQGFDAFTKDCDPRGEHDFGALEVGQDTIFWKIDYYDKTLSAASPDPADPKLTVRVLTIMLASEY